MAIPGWFIRPNSEPEYKCHDIYDGYDNLFSMKIHHGGVFTKFPGRSYVNGNVNYVDVIDMDAFSLHEMDSIMIKLGYEDCNMMYYHFEIPNSDLDVGLNALGSDQDIHHLSTFINEHKLINVYIEHGHTQLPKCHKVRIEEIPEVIPTNEQVGKCSRKLLLEWHEQQKENEFVGNDQEEKNEYGKETSNDKKDADYLVDEGNVIEEVEVDMRDFKLNIDPGVELKGCSNDGPDRNVDSEHEIVVLDNDDFVSPSDSSEDDIDRKRERQIRKIKKQCDVGVVQHSPFYVGQTFGSSKEVKDLIRKHSVDSRRELVIVKNDKIRVRTVCHGTIPIFSRPGQSQMVEVILPENRCPWALHVSKINDSETWMVKTFKDTHKCLQSRQIKHCTSVFLSKQIMGQIETNPEIPPKALQDELQKKLELSVSWMKAFRAKKKASNHIMGDYKQQYGILRDYCQELMNSNPGTTVTIDVEPLHNATDETRQFKRIYVCIGALKEGFKAGMRDLLGLDGAFMKGPYPGQVLTAVGVDGNNGIYPVAYAIVEAETINSWTWFLECLGSDLELGTNSNFTFISDRQKGILPAIAKVFPCAEHRYCLRHIHENMKLKWKGKAFKDLLWKCATSTTIQRFQQSMQEMRHLNLQTFQWLSNIPAQHWTRSHFTGRAHSDILLNNLCEVLNKELVGARDKPIITSLEFIREYLMKRIVNVQKVIEKSDGPLTPTATKLLENIKREAAQYTVIWNGGEKFQVSGPWGDQCVVDVNLRVCSCRQWELTGIPCKHAVATNWNMVLNKQEVGLSESWCHPCYWLDTWKQVYNFKVCPITGRSTWPKSNCPTTLTPPIHHNPVGRPKKKRRKSVDEKDNMAKHGKLSRSSKINKCGKCGNLGHNSRTCKGQSEGGSKRKVAISQGKSQGGSKRKASSNHGGNQSGS